MFRGAKNTVCFSLLLQIILAYCFLINAYPQEKPAGIMYTELDSYIRYMPSRSVEAMPGKIEIAEAATQYGYDFKLFDKIPMKFYLDSSYVNINSSVDNVDLPSHLNGLALGLEIILPFFSLDKTYQLLGISPAFYGDDFESETSGFRTPFYYLIIRQPSEKLTFLAGFSFYPDYENEILPAVGLIYKPNDKLRFNLIPIRPNITYMLDESLALFVEGSSSINSEFEVDRGDSENVVLRYKGMRLGGGLRLKFQPALEASFCVGADFNRSFKYRDDEGKVNLKDTVYTELRLQIKY
ncbi:MAG: hypothetical protein DRP74_00025 [Candidatus Omnitrophota bacterium]|nr:MAG: hypothetical protein DRP74_00025 [Candidatus Omnitrophota bacterium]